ncbi:TPA: site-specific integrase [Vibrio vulnificus]|uniref:tyrosine-type recombinase/integrase n=1 Tax=Vibrio vulnificus TaxID=672 RepID=UPI00130288DB|nr:tyrosine-type recombinase/integrase [Vibrio vulnificus]MCU8207092.1 tyrosine-type recombinase/integrase [Vibrio vulnificus]HAS8422846.1 site-specific integrase [Vibrio vulnificus]
MKEHAPIGKHHIVVKQKVATSPATIFPILYLEGSHGYSIMWSLVEYFLAHSSKSDTWMGDTARAIGLFYDYSTTIHKSELDKRAQFRKFLSCLERGTIDTETHQDETNLYWAPTGLDKTKRLRTRLVAFIDWIESEEQEASGKSTFIASKKKNEKLTLSLLKTARNIIKRSPMSHTKDVVKVAGQLSQSKETLGYEFEDDPKNYINAQSENKAFPVELIAPLLQFGFVKNPIAENPFEREDITAKMITILLLFGGLRKGEPFHLWFNDVIPYSDFQCQAKLYHPRLAKTNLFGEKEKTREEYLKERHMRPRHDKMNSKSLRARWKKLAVDKTTYHADIFFLHPSAEAMFVTLYQMYLPYRSKLMETYVKNKGHDHPFLFVSTGVDRRTGESYVGAPYSVKGFTESFNKALNRLEQHIGMRIERGRDSALNPHALRHCFVQVLEDAGVDKKVIQKCMHHRTINAQEAYKGISSQKIQEVLANYSVSSVVQSKMQLTKS